MERLIYYLYLRQSIGNQIEAIKQMTSGSRGNGGEYPRREREKTVWSHRMYPAVVRNVILRWGSTVLWWFYPWRGYGKESDQDAGSRSGWMRCCSCGYIVGTDEFCEVSYEIPVAHRPLGIIRWGI